MSGKSKIEWTDRVWNPVTGCTKISLGCANCYAERMTKRFWPEKDFNKVTLHPERLGEPLRWRKPSKIFVCSMSDLFHDDVPFEFIQSCFDQMSLALHHTFLILTKRPKRMLEFSQKGCLNGLMPGAEPLNNVWIGVTAENQQMADERIPLLLQIPAATRFVSVEPMLGPVDLQSEALGDTLCRCDGCMDLAKKNPDMWQAQRIDWVICGGESGPGARPMHPYWARDLRDQCQVAGLPFFFKQWGEFCAPSQMTEQTYQEWEHQHGTENCYGEDDPRWRVGKKKAGRLLDGGTWDEYPEVKTNA